MEKRGELKRTEGALGKANEEYNEACRKCRQADVEYEKALAKWLRAFAEHEYEKACIKEKRRKDEERDESI